MTLILAGPRVRDASLVATVFRPVAPIARCLTLMCDGNYDDDGFGTRHVTGCSACGCRAKRLRSCTKIRISLSSLNRSGSRRPSRSRGSWPLSSSPWTLDRRLMRTASSSYHTAQSSYHVSRITYQGDRPPKSSKIKGTDLQTSPITDHRSRGQTSERHGPTPSTYRREP